MKKRILTILFGIIILLSGCSFKHEHAYVEETVEESTCTSKGFIKYTCRCGDSYTEELPLKMHEYGDFVYDNNATFKMNGTETAECKICGKKFSRKVEGTKLKREITDMRAVLFLKPGVQSRREDGVRCSYPKNYPIKVNAITNDGYFRFEDYDGTYWIHVEDVQPPMSREITDYRSISSLSELKKYDDWDFDWFNAHHMEIEKVVYLQDDKYYLLYDYRWFDNGVSQILAYDFMNEIPWGINPANHLRSEYALGSYEYYEEEHEPLEWLKLYNSLMTSDDD